MTQELESMKYFDQRNRQELEARRRAAGFCHWRFAIKNMISLVVWAAILGGGGFLVYNAVNRANSNHSWSGQGGGPAMSIMTYCMSLVDFNWDKKVEREIRRNPRPDPPAVQQVPESAMSKMMQELPPPPQLPNDL